MPLRCARVVVLWWAVASVCWVVAAVAVLVPSGHGVGSLLVLVAPEVTGGVLAWRLARGARAGRVRLWPLMLVTVVELVLAVEGAAGSGGLGLPQLVLPVIVLVLLLYGGRAYRGQVFAVSAGEAGATLVSYVGLIVIASLILGCLYATGMVARVQVSTRAAVCTVLGGTGCGAPSADPAPTSATATPAGRRPPGTAASAQGARDGRDRQVCDGWHLCLHCHGFWGCAGAVGMQIVDIPVGAFDQLNNDVNGILHLPFTDLGAVASGVWHHPGAAVMQVLSGEGNDDINNGEYGTGAGATIVSVGGLFLAGAGVLGKLGKLGRIANLGDAAPLSDLGNLTDLTSDATRAANNADKAAKSGDVPGAQKAAARAADDARKARAKVRRDGCALAALGDVPALQPAHIGGRFAAPLIGDGCGPKRRHLDEARRAEQRASEDVYAARRAAEAKWLIFQTYRLKPLWKQTMLPKGMDLQHFAPYANEWIRDFVRNPENGKIGKASGWSTKPVTLYYNDEMRTYVAVDKSHNVLDVRDNMPEADYMRKVHPKEYLKGGQRKIKQQYRQNRKSDEHLSWWLKHEHH